MSGDDPPHADHHRTGSGTRCVRCRAGRLPLVDDRTRLSGGRGPERRAPRPGPADRPPHSGRPALPGAGLHLSREGKAAVLHVQHTPPCLRDAASRPNSGTWLPPPSPRTPTATSSPGGSPARKSDAAPWPPFWTAGTRRAGEHPRSAASARGRSGGGGCRAQRRERRAPALLPKAHSASDTSWRRITRRAGSSGRGRRGRGRRGCRAVTRAPPGALRMVDRSGEGGGEDGLVHGRGRSGAGAAPGVQGGPVRMSPAEQADAESGKVGRRAPAVRLGVATRPAM